MRAVALLILVGCGRLGFDPVSPIDALPDVPFSDGLVAYYDMDAFVVSPQTNALLDLSGHSNTGTCTGVTCPVVIAGHLGGAMQFDGIDDHIDVAASVSLDGTLAFTMAAWILPASLPVDPLYSCAINKVAAGGSDSYQLCVTFAGQWYASIDATASQDLYTANNSAVVGVWTHVAIAWDGVETSLFINGVERTSAMPLGDLFDTNPLELGYDIDTGGPVAPFAGAMDEVRIYDRTLTSTEILELAST